ncbi:MAG: siroheme synthase [Hyphomicrobiales bacterium]|nr:MAG: siroheme synthase [Hyphomicrobiales bacterium]
MKIISSQHNKPSSSKRRNRVEDLATLPVFFKLKDKQVLIANGSDAACWKAELLAASGAVVHVYATTLSADFSELLNGSNASRFIWHKTNWNQDSFDDMSIAIIDAQNDEEARAFYDTAKSMGVPVNVIDNPPFCDFQFGSIVNRSPVVISISTDGAAPILGQAIRRRIETLLPKTLAHWAQAATDIRGHVNATRQMGAERRTYWNAFVDLAFGRSLPNEFDLKSLGYTSANKGRVSVVGAGPGNEELLTLKAVRALQSADIILFDDCVSNSILELARREAKRMLVEDSEDDISAAMVQLAKNGKHVVQLKSGDPSFLAATNTQLAALKQLGITVEIIPGISAASAMAAAKINLPNIADQDYQPATLVAGIVAGR